MSRTHTRIETSLNTSDQMTTRIESVSKYSSTERLDWDYVHYIWIELDRWNSPWYRSASRWMTVNKLLIHVKICCDNWRLTAVNLYARLLRWDQRSKIILARVICQKSRSRRTTHQRAISMMIDLIWMTWRKIENVSVIMFTRTQLLTERKLKRALMVIFIEVSED